jgi:hypothetical protein
MILHYSLAVQHNAVQQKKDGGFSVAKLFVIAQEDK